MWLGIEIWDWLQEMYMKFLIFLKKHSKTIFQRNALEFSILLFFKKYILRRLFALKPF